LVFTKRRAGRLLIALAVSTADVEPKRGAFQPLPDRSFQQPIPVPVEALDPEQSVAADSAGSYCASSQTLSCEDPNSVVGYGDALTDDDAGPMPILFTAATVKA
jgi:hypothetical protein